MHHLSRRSLLTMLPAALTAGADSYPERWSVNTGLDNTGLAAGKVDGKVRLFVAARTPYAVGKGAGPGYLLALDGATGRTLFKQQVHTGGISVFPSFLEPQGVGPAIFVATGAYTPSSVGEARLVSARTGKTIWSQPTSDQFFGNGSVVMADLDGDGRQELVYGDHAAVRCFDARTGTPKWVYNDRVAICHGRTAMGTLGGGQQPVLVLGTEYSNADKSSSMLALDGRGRVLWRKDGFPGDLGSTPAVLADVDGDGHSEILKVELDLEHRNRMRWASLYCLRANGETLYRADFGVSGMAVGDLDGDGILEAVGIADSRDGGSEAARQIRCLNLRTGKLKWTTPVERTWLGSQDPVIADLTGRGGLNVLVTTNNPSGYGRRRSEPPYGDTYILAPDGRIVWKRVMPDFIHQPFVSDLDGDGRNEIVLACQNGLVTCLATPGRAGRLWSVTGGNFRRTYSTEPVR